MAMKEFGGVFDGFTITNSKITLFFTPKKSKYLRAGEVYEMRFEVPLVQDDKNLIMENCEEVTEEKLAQFLYNFEFKK